MKNRAKLTDSVCEKLKPDTKEVFIYDEGLPGLALRVQPSGVKSWTLYKRVGLKVIKKSLGKFPIVNTAAARKLAIDAMSTLDEVKPAAKPKLTCDQVMQKYLEEYALVHTSPDNYKNATSGWNKHAGDLRGKLITMVTTNDVQKWVNTIGKTGKTTANRRFNDFRAAVRWAKRQGIIDFEKDPTSDVTTHDTYGRERYLSREEWGRLDAVLKANPGDVADIIYLLYATGARKTTVLSMEWNEVDLGAKSWVIPARKDKGRKTETKALSDIAIEVLERRRFKTKGAGFVFPSEQSETGYVTQIQHAWEEIRKEAGLYDQDPEKCFHIHDLRHTVGTWMAQDGFNAFLIKDALGHSNVSTTQGYVTKNRDTVRGALNQIQRGMKRA